MSDLEKLAIEQPKGGDDAAPSVRKPGEAGKRPVRKSMSPFANAPDPKKIKKPARFTAKNKEGRLPPRPDRVPFGTRQAKLGYPKREGYERRWVNDVGSRIMAAIAGGWDFVEEKGEKVTRPAGTKDGGGGLVVYLMEIPEEFYSDDFWAKQDKIDETDAQIMDGTLNMQADDRRYVPKGAIDIQVRKGLGK